jgi:hypothetical protein
MRNRRRLVASIASAALVSTGTLVAVMLVNAPTAAADPPSAPYTAWAIDGGRGSWILHGTRYLTTIEKTGTDDYVSFHGQSSPGGWDMTVSPPTGSSWAAGQVYQARTAPADATHAYITLTGEGRGCSGQQGTLTVKDVARDAENEVTAFAASWSLTCTGYLNPLTGEIRYNSSVGWKAAITDKDHLDFSYQPMGTPSAPQTVTLTGRGSQSVTFGTATIDGAAASDFAITGDTCSGQALAFDATCTVTVVATTTALGDRIAGLVVPDDTVGGLKFVSLYANGTTPPPPPLHNEGTYYPLQPFRLLDTRQAYGAPPGKLGSGATLNLDVAGRGEVPSSGVSAVVLNVTVTNGTTPSYLTVYPQGQTRPTASSLNFVGGWDRGEHGDGRPRCHG